MALSLAERRRIAKHIRATNPHLVIFRFIWRDVSGDTHVRADVDEALGPLKGKCRQEILFGYAGDILDEMEAAQ